MIERRFGTDSASLDVKVVEETDLHLVMSAVIVREMVQPYPDGRALKAADELEKAAWTAEGRWVTVMKHSDTVT